MQKKIINLLSIVLVATGIGSGLLILYDYLESPHLISKDQAMAIALQSSWGQSLKDRTVSAYLLHTVGNGWAFPVDEKTLQDIIPHCPQNGQCITPQESRGIQAWQYIWVVGVNGHPPSYHSPTSQEYVINATSGQVLRILV